MTRYVIKHWNSALSPPGPFGEWLERVAPTGARLASVVVLTTNRRDS